MTITPPAFTPELEEWANRAGFEITPASATSDQRALFWSSGGEERIYVDNRTDGWYVVTRSNRFSDEDLLFAARSMPAVERYFFADFAQPVRSTQGLPVLLMPKSLNLLQSGYTIEGRSFDDAPCLALVAADGSIVAVSAEGKLIGTGKLIELSRLMASTPQEIKDSLLHVDGSPLLSDV